MENKQLKKIREDLSMLPVLQERVERLRQKITDAERHVRMLLEKYEKECLDVDQLKNNSLSAILLKMIGKYEGKLEKESQEMITAKMEYDKAQEQVKTLYCERDEVDGRISALLADKQKYEAEIRKREQMVLEKMDDAISEKYRNLEREQERLQRQCVEAEEAIRAARRVKSTAQNAIGHLESAESWASYDVWFKGGIISHMAKYNHIDEAQANFNRLSHQLEGLKKELSDINLLNTPGMGGIDTTTRAIDFWFDNIFTDLRVRERIRDDAFQLRKLYSSIEKTILMIEKEKSDIRRMLEDIERQKENLLILL